MTTDEVTFVNTSFLSQLRESEERMVEESKLLISLHGVEFAEKREGYWEVASDIYFSNLIYLLYIKNVAAGKDFATAKERARSVLVSELEKKKYAIVTKTMVQPEEAVDTSNSGRKLILLDRAISMLETDKNEPLFCTY